MAIIYSEDYTATAPYDGTFSASSRTALADGIKAGMASSGWSVASGASGDWTLALPTTHPNGSNVQLRIWDPGSGNCARIAIKSPVDLTGTNPMYLLPNSATWRITSTGYFVHAYDTSDIAGTRARFTFGSVFIPADLQGSPSSYTNVCFTLANGTSDSAGSSAAGSFNNSSNSGQNVVDTSSGTGNLGGTNVSLLSISGLTATSWANDAALTWMPLVDVNVSSSVFVYGYLFDVFLTSSNVAIGTNWTYDGNTFCCLHKIGTYSVMVRIA